MYLAAWFLLIASSLSRRSNDLHMSEIGFRLRNLNQRPSASNFGKVINCRDLQLKFFKKRLQGLTAPAYNSPDFEPGGVMVDTTSRTSGLIEHTVPQPRSASAGLPF